jgi:hypothetical protein
MRGSEGGLVSTARLFVHDTHLSAASRFVRASYINDQSETDDIENSISGGDSRNVTSGCIQAPSGKMGSQCEEVR